VNWQHFRSILWLRWRLWWNRIKKAGTVQAVILGIFAVFAVLFGGAMLVLAFVMGGWVVVQAAPIPFMFLWDLMVLGFIFAWVAGLLTDLQRSEGLSLDKLMHLPVSLGSAFVMNYLTSLIGLRMIIFLPALIGLSLGLVFAKGPIMLMLGPLLFGFLLMVTAITYQFQGWLASLMVNKRRRRLIVVVITASFIVLGQLPNILGNFFRGNIQEDVDRFHGSATKVEPTLENKKLTKEEYDRRQKELEGQLHAFANDPFHLARIGPTAQLANLVLPPGWLPLGAMGLAEGNILPAVFATVGMTLLGSISLWRSYRTTMRLYTGRFTSLKQSASAIPSKADTALATRSAPITTSLPVPIYVGRQILLEKKLPGLSEHVSAVALAGLRSFLRAPEAILMLLTPVIITLVFGGVILRNRSSMPPGFRPLVAFGAMTIVLLANQHIMCNQFGFDRNGFRVYVLSPARRKDILFGKNLTMAPLILGLGGMMAIMIQVLTPMRWDLFLAVIPQYLSMYLIFCLLANCMSILAPAPLAAGAFRRSNFRGWPLLFQIAFIFIFPVAQAPMLLPYGLEKILEDLGGLRGLPICLLLSVGEFVAVAFLFRFVLELEGSWLQVREKKILEIVATKAE